jgi:hypothetical protein
VLKVANQTQDHYLISKHTQIIEGYNFDRVLLLSSGIGFHKLFIETVRHNKSKISKISYISSPSTAYG